MLVGKEFDDVGSTKLGGAVLLELDSTPQFDGFRSNTDVLIVFS